MTPNSRPVPVTRTHPRRAVRTPAPLGLPVPRGAGPCPAPLGSPGPPSARTMAGSRSRVSGPGRPAGQASGPVPALSRASGSARLTTASGLSSGRRPRHPFPARRLPLAYIISNAAAGPDGRVMARLLERAMRPGPAGPPAGGDSGRQFGASSAIGPRPEPDVQRARSGSQWSVVAPGSLQVSRCTALTTGRDGPGASSRLSALLVPGFKSRLAFGWKYACVRAFILAHNRSFPEFSFSSTAGRPNLKEISLQWESLHVNILCCQKVSLKLKLLGASWCLKPLSSHRPPGSVAEISIMMTPQ